MKDSYHIPALPTYVPAPEPVQTQYLIGAHYFPGWKSGTHRGWEVLEEYPDRMPLLQMSILASQITVEGFLIGDHYVVDGVDRRPRWRRELTQWIDEGHIYYREDVTDGLENAPETFIGMFHGENFGKTLVRVSA